MLVHNSAQLMGAMPLSPVPPSGRSRPLTMRFSLPRRWATQNRKPTNTHDSAGTGSDAVKPYEQEQAEQREPSSLHTPTKMIGQATRPGRSTTPMISACAPAFTLEEKPLAVVAPLWQQACRVRRRDATTRLGSRLWSFGQCTMAAGAARRKRESLRNNLRQALCCDAACSIFPMCGMHGPCSQSVRVAPLRIEMCVTKKGPAARRDPWSKPGGTRRARSLRPGPGRWRHQRR